MHLTNINQATRVITDNVIHLRKITMVEGDSINFPFQIQERTKKYPVTTAPLESEKVDLRFRV